MKTMKDDVVYSVDDPEISSNDEMETSDVEEETSSGTIQKNEYLITQVKITNSLLCGIIFFMGLIFGIIGLHLLFSRIGNGKEN